MSLATRMDDLHAVGVSIEESITALAAFEAIDEAGKELCRSWLEELEVLLAQYDKVYALRTPKQWETYRLMAITNLREQTMLEAAKKKIRKHWKNRPGPIR